MAIACINTRIIQNGVEPAQAFTDALCKMVNYKEVIA